MDKIPFQDGTRISRAKVTIDGVDYFVTPAQFSGTTPFSAFVMNKLQENIENAINQNVDNIGGNEYDNTKTYEIGDIVKYQGQLYICIETIDTAEEFDDTKWAETDVLSSAGGNEIAIGSSSDITGKTKIYVEEATQRLKYKDSTTGQFTDIAGDEVFVGEEQNIPDSTKLWIDTDEMLPESSEVVNSLDGNETTKAPSVNAVKNRFKYSTEEQVVGEWINGKPLYRVSGYTSIAANSNVLVKKITNLDIIVKANTFLKRSGDYSNINNWGTESSDFGTLYVNYYYPGIIFNTSYPGTLYYTLEYTKTTD